MADAEHVQHLQKGVAFWNTWRTEHPDTRPDLRDASLAGLHLRGINLSNTDLSGADLQGADLSQANLRGVHFSKSILDVFTKYDDVVGCDVGVNGLYSPETDSAALLRLDPPGNSMQGSSAEAVLESLRHARKLHTFSLLLAGIALLFIVIKPKTITLPYLAGSFKFDELSYSFLAMILSTVLLVQASSFIDSALKGARYLNDRKSAMLVGHFPWLLSKYERGQPNEKHSKIIRLSLVFHPVVYLYFFTKWDLLFSANWAALVEHYREMPVIFGEYLLPVVYVVLMKLCLHIFKLVEGFQKPILFDTATERARRSDMERLAAAVEAQSLRTTELVELMRKREK
jgi:uncharacterized protein YjbI with pentapeptide repeats